jgi:hypothetical protein
MPKGQELAAAGLMAFTQLHISALRSRSTRRLRHGRYHGIARKACRAGQIRPLVGRLGHTLLMLALRGQQ